MDDAMGKRVSLRRMPGSLWEISEFYAAIRRPRRCEVFIPSGADLELVTWMARFRFLSLPRMDTST
jgi:hypothetical protein